MTALDFISRTLPIELLVVVLLILRVLLLLAVALPAVWSRQRGRREDARAVLRVLLKVRDTDTGLPGKREDEAPDAPAESAVAPNQGHTL